MIIFLNVVAIFISVTNAIIFLLCIISATTLYSMIASLSSLLTTPLVDGGNGNGGSVSGVSVVMGLLGLHQEQDALWEAPD